MRRSGTRFQRPCYASSPPPYAAPLLGRPVIKSQQSVKPASSLLKPFLLGTATPWSNLAAIPPGLAGVQDTALLRCWRRQSPDKPALDCAGLRSASASWRRTSIRRVVPVRDHRCIPHQRLCVAHSFGPSRPRPRRPSSHPSRRSLPLLQGACSLPSAALQSPPPPHTRPPPRPRSTSFRVLWHCQTLSRHPRGPRTQSRRLRDWTAP